MELLKHFFYRVYQKLMIILVKLVPNKKQLLINGDLTLIIPELVKLNAAKYLIVTDAGIVKAGILEKLTNQMKQANLKFDVYDKTTPNPEIELIESAYKYYKEVDATAIIAIGGGSPIDLAKVLAAKVVHPNKDIKKMRGILKVIAKIPPLIVIPTTSGTGSEVTIAAVVSDHQTNSKFAIIDPNLLPDIALLDPKLTIGMPPFITATTGLDALTHAIEAYLGNSNTKETETYALEAIKLVFDNLEIAFKDPNNLLAREKMQIAAYKAGYAFTRAYVGNVHAMAHALGGSYNVVHGLTNAVLMPYVFRKYGPKAHLRLANIADYLSIVDKKASLETKAEALITKIEVFNNKLGMPKKILGVIQTKDIDKLVNHAYAEANPFYPVPRIFTKKDFLDLYYEVSDLLK